ncbi:MAG: endonuclease MutS2 [Microscillaceae bacterium]|jgi:DNA mismatch repair protein MutS2|nr:endonuclease MutS2 [Microscillaceae bacterium]
MLYPENIESRLGFDKIRELLKAECVSSLGQAFVDKIRFVNNYELIQKLTQQTAEFCDILRQDEGFPTAHYLDVSESLNRALPENSFLTESDFFDLKLSLSTIYECLKFFRKRPAEVYPNLRELTLELIFDPDLIDKIELVIDERGKIRDNASYELRRIRQELLTAQNHLRKRLEQILKTAKQQGFINEDANLTLRDGRMVIPLVAEHKRKIKGFVHDESATGQTVYLEPAEVIDMNNEIRELEYQERREIIRILTQLTNEVRPHIAHLRKSYIFLGLMDFVRAKARFALKTESLNPIFEKKPLLKWYHAKHPLLLLNFHAQGKKVVPLDIELNAQKRILLISGPNAGGKSVALKTVGLVQYMYQCGLLVPMGEGSRIGIFRDIFIDIGDQQSLENDLSTYSSHLKNMKYFLEFADSKTLLLIDEFGTGTEPQMGGAIAETILDKLNHAKAFGVITTHYANLKFYAENNQGVVNGAMQFDGKKLEPLYSLDMGRPGSSYAFEIAQKIGLPKAIIQKSRQQVGFDQVNYDKLLNELDIEKKHYEQQNKFINEKTKRLDEVTLEYEKLKAFLDNEKKRILNQAKNEAKELLKSANQKIEQAIRQIKENQAEKVSTKEIRQELQTFATELKLEQVDFSLIEEDTDNEEVTVIEGIIGVGDKVRIKGQLAIGEVLAIKGKDVEMMMGELKSNIKLNRLEKVSRKMERELKKELSAVKGVNINEKMANFSLNLDLRGKRGEEAMVELGNFMDDALLLNQQELRIIHGKGDGILRKLVRDLLKQYKEVASLQDEHADRGGAGVTIVTLK